MKSCKYIYYPYVHIQRVKNILQLTALAAVALAEPEADAYYGYGGYYGHGLYGYGYGHQLGWPSYRAPGFESTVWGARGKRSAEPSAEPHGYGFYGYHPYAYGLYHPYAFRHHVAAVAAPEGTGVAGHPGGATSYSHRSPQGLGKRLVFPVLLHNPSLISAEFGLIWGLVGAELDLGWC